MIDASTANGLGLLFLVILGIIGNHVGARYLKNKGTTETKTYIDDLVKALKAQIGDLESEVGKLKQENLQKAEALKTAQAERDTAREERDAARTENHTLLERLEEERQNVVKMSNNLEEQEKRLQVLEQAAGKNEAVKEAAQEIVTLIKESLRQLVAELMPKTTVATPAPEGSAT